MSWSVGLDFGTTNSAISVIDGAGAAGLVNFYRASGPTPMFRSVLYFDPDEVAAINGRPVPVCGPQGIDLYLEEDDGTGRLMQSLKTWLASKSFSHTVVGQRAKFTLEQLISILLKDLRAEAEATLGDLGARAVVGRPVHLSQPANPERDEHGIERLRDALSRAGFDEVTFVYEPVAAAYHYERRLERDEVVMIADFGGGTSDFSIIRVGPSRVGRQDRFSLKLKERLAQTKITVNTVHPGYVKSDLFANMGPRSFDAVPTADHGARSAIHAATSPELAGVSGRYFYLEREDRRLSALAQDPALAQTLWDKSMGYLGGFVTSAQA